MLTLTYGDVILYGLGNYPLLIQDIQGLAPVEYEYNMITYRDEDGQESVSARALSRAITFTFDIIGSSAASDIRGILKTLRQPNYLYIADDMSGIVRRIYCRQATISDPTRVLRGQIGTITVQYVCDNPFFEDINETVRVVYGREKNITTPFTLPRAFAVLNNGTTITNSGDTKVEPIYTIECNETISGTTYIDLFVGDNSIRINDYQATVGDVITIDVKERSVSYLIFFIFTVLLFDL